MNRNVGIFSKSNRLNTRMYVLYVFNIQVCRTRKKTIINPIVSRILLPLYAFNFILKLCTTENIVINHTIIYRVKYAFDRLANRMSFIRRTEGRYKPLSANVLQLILRFMHHSTLFFFEVSTRTKRTRINEYVTKDT